MLKPAKYSTVSTVLPAADIPLLIGPGQRYILRYTSSHQAHQSYHSRIDKYKRDLVFPCVHLRFLIFGLDSMSNCVILVSLHVVEILEAFLICLAKRIKKRHLL